MQADKVKVLATLNPLRYLVTGTRSAREALDAVRCACPSGLRLAALRVTEVFPGRWSGEVTPAAPDERCLDDIRKNPTLLSKQKVGAQKEKK